MATVTPPKAPNVPWYVAPYRMVHAYEAYHIYDSDAPSGSFPDGLSIAYNQCPTRTSLGQVYDVYDLNPKTLRNICGSTTVNYAANQLVFAADVGASTTPGEEEDGAYMLYFLSGQVKSATTMDIQHSYTASSVVCESYIVRPGGYSNYEQVRIERSDVTFSGNLDLGFYPSNSSDPDSAIQHPGYNVILFSCTTNTGNTVRTGNIQVSKCGVTVTMQIRQLYDGYHQVDDDDYVNSVVNNLTGRGGFSIGNGWVLCVVKTGVYDDSYGTPKDVVCLARLQDNASAEFTFGKDGYFEFGMNGPNQTRQKFYFANNSTTSGSSDVKKYWWIGSTPAKVYSFQKGGYIEFPGLVLTQPMPNIVINKHTTKITADTKYTTDSETIRNYFGANRVFKMTNTDWYFIAVQHSNDENKSTGLYIVSLQDLPSTTFTFDSDGYYERHTWQPASTAPVYPNQKIYWNGEHQIEYQTGHEGEQSYATVTASNITTLTYSHGSSPKQMTSYKLGGAYVSYYGLMVVSPFPQVDTPGGYSAMKITDSYDGG